MKERFVEHDPSFRYQKYAYVDMADLRPKRMSRLRDIFQAEAKPGSAAKRVTKDIDTWLSALTGSDKRCRDDQQFAAMATLFMEKVPGHRVYRKENDQWVAYYVYDIEWHAENRDKPSCTIISFAYREFGVIHSQHMYLGYGDCAGKLITEVLANGRNGGYVVETNELREEYLANLARWEELTPQIGLQCVATGAGTDDLDGNPERSWFSRNETYLFSSNNKVVIDVFRESDKQSNERDASGVDSRFWSKRRQDITEEELEEAFENGDVIDDDENEDDVSGGINKYNPEPYEIPIHPTVAVFDLRRHVRLRVHANALTEYVYDKTLSERLVLPTDVREFVNMLLNHRNTFKDIIEGKGDSTTVMSAGIPGVGKTLTAEVYSESLERPLYSIQCSQLGTDEKELEKNLLRSFSRAARWNAILLLDEADVYVAERGSDIQQNAIVGVFLRVLEYYSGTLFMTTNRADKIDDAILSRCIARIDYATPPKEDQKKIWRILADTSSIDLSDEMIDQIVEKNPKLTGREIKNVLKLSMMLSSMREEPITTDTVEFARRFKPTLGESEKT